VSGPTIRRASSADASALHTLAEQTFPLACPPGTSAEDVAAFVAEVLSEEAFRRYLDDPRYTVFLAEVDGEAVGYAMAIDREPDVAIAGMLRHSPALELSKFYVLASHHGSLVAGALLAEVVGLARGLGSKSIWLGVNRFNERANRFYERNGFEVVGHREFVVGDQVEQDFVREKPLVSLPDVL
jgi:diamine N-acetyltransferase